LLNPPGNELACPAGPFCGSEIESLHIGHADAIAQWIEIPIRTTKFKNRFTIVIFRRLRLRESSAFPFQHKKRRLIRDAASGNHILATAPCCIPGNK
jgi:hypothetical protein